MGNDIFTTFLVIFTIFWSPTSYDAIYSVYCHGRALGPGERAGWGRGGAAGGLGAGVRSGAAGRLVASGRAASGNGHAREQGRHVRGLGKHWDTGDGKTRWDAGCVDEMLRAEQATGKHTDFIHGRWAHQGLMHAHTAVVQG